MGTMNLVNHKHERIVEAISALTLRLGDDAFDILDHWEGDLCAIGIASPDNHGVLVYISTFERLDRFYVSLELPPDLPEDFPYKNAGSMEAGSIEELIEIVRGHLKPKSNCESDPGV